MLKITKSKEMLWDGYGVRFSIKLKWREKAFAHKALEKLKFVENQLLDEARSQWIKEEASWYSVVLLAKNK
jgi:translation initiation factor IF-3